MKLWLCPPISQITLLYFSNYIRTVNGKNFIRTNRIQWTVTLHPGLNSPPSEYKQVVPETQVVKYGTLSYFINLNSPQKQLGMLHKFFFIIFTHWWLSYLNWVFSNISMLKMLFCAPFFSPNNAFPIRHLGLLHIFPNNCKTFYFMNVSWFIWLIYLNISFLGMLRIFSPNRFFSTVINNVLVCILL